MFVFGWLVGSGCFQRKPRDDEESRRKQGGRRGEKTREENGSNEEEEEEFITTDTAGLQSELIGRHPPFPFNSSHFLSSSFCQEGIEEEEVRFSIVTIKDDSCPSEPYSTAHLEITSQIKKTKEGGNKEEEAVEKKSVNRGDEDGDEEQLTCLHLQSQVGPQSSMMCSVFLIEQICFQFTYYLKMICVQSVRISRVCIKIPAD